MLSLLLSVLASAVLSIQPVYVVVGDSEAEAEHDPISVLDSMIEEVNHAFLNSSNGQLRPTWDEVETIHVEDDSWDDVSTALRDHFDDQYIIAAIEQYGSRNCGVANIGPSWNTPAQLVGGVWEDCWRGDTFLHELLHMLSAVNSSAPSFVNGGHVSNENDVMNPTSGAGDELCGDGFILLDCKGDSYFNMNPESGSWLANNPQYNIANAPFLEIQQDDDSTSSDDEDSQTDEDTSNNTEDDTTNNNDDSTNDGVVRRISGSNRFATAVAVSQHRFPNGAEHVIIANGTSVIDSMSASGMLSQSPILYVTTNRIPSSTRQELQRLNPSEITIVGGPAVVSDNVIVELRQHTN